VPLVKTSGTFAFLTENAERQNLTMRMSMRRFPRLTNAFSKEVGNHEAAAALHFMHYNSLVLIKLSASPRRWKQELPIMFGRWRKLLACCLDFQSAGVQL
jgi:hypothetical protein